MNSRELLASLTTPPWTGDMQIDQGGPIREGLAGEPGDEIRFPLFTRTLVARDGGWFRVTVEEILDNGTGL